MRHGMKTMHWRWEEQTHIAFLHRHSLNSTARCLWASFHLVINLPAETSPLLSVWHVSFTALTASPLPLPAYLP